MRPLRDLETRVSDGTTIRMTPERIRASADLLGQPDENALGALEVAEPIHVSPTLVGVAGSQS
jgi:hypothetical protein